MDEQVPLVLYCIEHEYMITAESAFTTFIATTSEHGFHRILFGVRQLFDAATIGDVAEVSRLIKRGVNMEAKDEVHAIVTTSSLSINVTAFPFSVQFCLYW